MALGLLNLRSWSDSDAGSDREISAAIYPEYQQEASHPAWFPARQLGAPDDCAHRWVVEETGSDRRVPVPRFGELRPRRYRFDLAVRPEWQRQGIASRLLDEIMRVAHELDATGLQARVRDDKPEAPGFAVSRDFRESHRMGAYRLEFARADGLDAACARLRARGIEVTNLAAAREQDAGWSRTLLGSARRLA